MSARDVILQRVRAAHSTGFVPQPGHHGHVAREHLSPPSRTEGGLDRFLRELSALGVEAYVEASAANVRARVAEMVAGRHVFSWDAAQLPYDLWNALPGATATGASTRDLQAAADIGVTGCHAAIAETGSLVVLSGRGTPRAASLLPPVHLCVVQADQLYPTMGEFFAARSGDIASAACCTFITGPSRTADIELTLTLGVHGPGKVIVVVGPALSEVEGR
jgi:L-lactate dehydrogenase complex protein LldG